MAEPLEDPEDPRVFNPTSEEQGATDSSTPPEPIENQEYKGQDKARSDFIQRKEFGGKPRRYPLDVDSSPHYVVFYPLVRSESKLGRLLQKKYDTFDISDQNRLTGDNAGNSAAAAGALEGAGAGGVLGLGQALLGNGGNGGPTGTALGPLRKIATTAINTAGGAAVGALTGYAAVALSDVNKLQLGGGSITLQINSIQSQYKANWESADMGALAGAIGAGNFTGSGIPELAVRSAANVSKVFGGNGLENVVNANTKTVKNPYKEQLFRSMDNRRFTFEYIFMPKTEQEAVEVFGTSNTSTANQDNGGPAVIDGGGIIQKFLFHMHPEAQASGYFYTYPSEFLIIYYHAGKENTFVRKISNCVLTDMNVVYGAEGFTTFSNGMPSMATMQLTFTELEILTTQRIYQGY